MNPIGFNEQTLLLGKPTEMKPDECGSLPVQIGKTTEGYPMFLSKWVLTADEKNKLLETNELWLTVVSNVHPPVSIDVDKPTIQPC